MADLLRVGGGGATPRGGTVIWSVAEGSRGRRYREVLRAGEGIAHSLLLETAPDGRFNHLELTTPSGLLTLHPEGDGTLHGHAIVSDGIEHVRGERWDFDGIVLVEGSVVCTMAAALLLSGSLTAFSSVAHLAVEIPPTLILEIAPVRVERVDERAWRFGSDAATFVVDKRGLPALADGATWPLDETAEDLALPRRHALPPR